MAYQAKHRDPLFDSDMQVAIERRTRELVGLAIFGFGLAMALLLATYSPVDSSFFTASDAPVQNLLGKLGATVATAVYIVIGHGGWVVAMVPMVWGLRVLFHLGTERMFWPLVALLGTVCAFCVAAAYAATLTPAAQWTQNHNSGLGGLLGDALLGFLLTFLPITASAGVRLVSVPLGLGMVGLVLFSMGVTWGELRRVLVMAWVGTVLLYDGLMRLMTGAAGGAGGLARGVAARNAAARAARAEARAEAKQATPAPERRTRVAARRAEPVLDEEFIPEPLPVPQEPTVPPAVRRGLLRQVATLVRGPTEAPVPELVELEAPRALDGNEPAAPDDDQIKARIANAIKLRASRGEQVAPTPLPGDIDEAAELTEELGQALTDGLGRVEPPLRRRRGPDPLILKVPGAVPTAPMAELDPMDEPEPSYFEPGFNDLVPSPDLDALPTEALPVPAPRKLDRRVVKEGEQDVAQDYVPEQDYERDEPRVPTLASAPSLLAKSKSPAPQSRTVVHHPKRKAPVPSRRAQAEAQPTLAFEPEEATYEMPPLSLLTGPETVERYVLSDEALEENARMLENVLDDYGVKGEIVSVRPGPVVTMYELEPAPGLKASRVIGLSDDIARSMSALSARVSTVPGRTVIGIELPNVNREKVVLREILSARDYGDSNMRLPLALGKDIGGGPVVANLAKMPHLLIAGTTGSGKSVAINTMILSLLYRLTPDECRLIMIDPKMLELSVYDGIPHLLSPVVTDPKKAVVALKWVVAEMEDRYRKMSKMGVRNIEGYNGRVRDALDKNEMFSRTVQTGFDDETGDPVFETEEFAPEALPYIVVIVDEMADLMMVAGKEIEACIQRLAQMARASGIHLIMATQRPSVDVITGTIKANFPTRISFQVTSKIDSRTILGEMGAEQLLGMGDMLYMAGGAKITRVHGPFVSDEEVEEIVRHLKSFGPPEYVSTVLEFNDDENASNIDAVLGLGGNTDGEASLYDQAVAIVARDRKCSTSYIQRKLAIGYNKAARLVEQMEDEGVVGPSNSVGKREILVPEVNG